MSDFKVFCRGGRVFDISKKESERLEQALSTRNGGARWVDSKGNRIVLRNVVSIEVDEWEFGLPRGIEVPVEEPVVITEAEPTEDSPDAEIERKRAEALQELIEKSACQHENKDLYYQEMSTKQGPTRRYFPVCSFCGQRFRYVKAAELSEEEKAGAKLWDRD